MIRQPTAAPPAMAYPASLGLAMNSCVTEHNACDCRFVPACPDRLAATQAIAGREQNFAANHLAAFVLHHKLDAQRADDDGRQCRYCVRFARSRCVEQSRMQ